MLYYYSGTESYLKKSALKKICDTISHPELNTAEFWEASPKLYSFIDTFPFVGGKKVCILHYFPDDKAFLEISRKMPDFTDVYIAVSSYPDKRKKIVKEILELAQEKEFKKIDDQRLMQYILNGLRSFGYTQEEMDATKGELARAFRAYAMHADMDLECVQKHIKLIAYSGSLTKEHIQVFGPDGSDLRAYRLSTMLLAEDYGCLDFAWHLLGQGESAIGILSLIAYQVRICYKAVLFGNENYLSLIGIHNYQLYKDFKSHSAADYKKIYNILMCGVDRIKRGEPSWAVLEECLLASLITISEE